MTERFDDNVPSHHYAKPPNVFRVYVSCSFCLPSTVRSFKMTPRDEDLQIAFERGSAILNALKVIFKTKSCLFPLSINFPGKQLILQDERIYLSVYATDL